MPYVICLYNTLMKLGGEKIRDFLNKKLQIKIPYNIVVVFYYLHLNQVKIQVISFNLSGILNILYEVKLEKKARKLSPYYNKSLSKPLKLFKSL